MIAFSQERWFYRMIFLIKVIHSERRWRGTGSSPALPTLLHLIGILSLYKVFATPQAKASCPPAALALPDSRHYSMFVVIGSLKVVNVRPTSFSSSSGLGRSQVSGVENKSCSCVVICIGSCGTPLAKNRGLRAALPCQIRPDAYDVIVLLSLLSLCAHEQTTSTGEKTAHCSFPKRPLELRLRASAASRRSG